METRSLRWSWLAAPLVLAALSGALACSGGGDDGPSTDSVDVYLKDLPDWEEYSPIREDEPPHPVGEPGPVQDEPVGDREFRCQTTPYAVEKTPRELVMYNPDVEILWPGSLIQGRSYRDLDTLLGLTIAERTPIKVSIPALKTSDNFREVVPDLATVSQAIGAMVGSATRDDLQTPSVVSYDMLAFHSEEQFALSLELSGSYLGFSAAAQFEYDQTAEETTVVVHFIERMFEVVVAPPQTPRSFFSAAFTQAKLDEQVALGRIGPDNLPIYVSNVVYGRMFTFALTSTKSEQEIRAALQAAYSWGTGSVDSKLSATQQELIEQSKIKITALGGDADAIIDAIQTGDWRAYFSDPAPLSTATPLSYTFRSLGDGSVALVTETATYDRKVCSPRLVPGFLPVQRVALELRAPFGSASGDLNGDGLVDLVWNHRSTTNDVRVGFGKHDGTFDVVTGGVTTLDASPAGGWTDFKLLVADMDGDGKDDLVWNRVAAGRSETYVARSLGDGTFELQPAHVRTEETWTPAFTAAAARVRAKTTHPAPRDLLWTRVTSTQGTVAATVWGGAAPADLAPQVLTDPLPSPLEWTLFTHYGPPMVGDVTGDAADEPVWGATAAAGYWGACTAVNGGDGVFASTKVSSSAFPCGYHCPEVAGYRLGDVNGDGKADLLTWDRSFLLRRYCPSGCTEWMCDVGDDIGGACRRTYYWHGATLVAFADGVGGFVASEAQRTWPEMPVDPDLREVSGDGKADLVWLQLGASAKVTIATSQTDAGGAFTGFGPQADFAPRDTLPPGQTTWANFRVFYGDVNGDLRPDVVLNDANTVSSVYVLVR